MVVTVKVFPSTSESLNKTLVVTGTNGLVVAISLTATGASLTELIVTVTVAVSHIVGVPLSHTVYVYESVPLNPVFGVYVIVPSAFTTTTPLLAMVAILAVRASPSKSESFAITEVVTGVSSLVVAASSVATGASFTGLTVTTTIAVSHNPEPSHATYVIVSVRFQTMTRS